MARLVKCSYLTKQNKGVERKKGMASVISCLLGGTGPSVGGRASEAKRFCGACGQAARGTPENSRAGSPPCAEGGPEGSLQAFVFSQSYP